LIAALVGPLSSLAGATPSLVSVTPFDGVRSIPTIALSADGSTVVGSRPSFDTALGSVNRRAFVWTRSGGYRSFDELGPDAPSSTDFTPRDVSGDGRRVVGSIGDQPILWEVGGQTAPLSLLSGGTDGGIAHGISDNGNWIVGTAHDGRSYELARVAPDGSIVLIPVPLRVPVAWNVDDGTVIALSSEVGTALDVSNDGTAVGGLVLLPGILDMPAGFRWESSRGLQRVPTGDPTTAVNVPFARGAAAISSDGTTLVGRTLGPPTPGAPIGFRPDRAYLWNGTPGDGPDLGSDGLALLEMPSGVSTLASAQATAVSADGSTIVGTYVPDGNPRNTRPFLWTPDRGFQDLTVLLQTLGVPTTGWTLLEATDVSADGMTIIGTGQFRSELGRQFDGIWIAVIPEPSTALLLGLGLSFLAGLPIHPRR